MQARPIRRGPSSSSLSAEPQGVAQTTLTLLEEAEDTRDPELLFLVRVVARHGRALPGLVADLRRRAVAHPGMADRVLSTAHRAKGLEWERVRLAGRLPGLGAAGPGGPGGGPPVGGGGGGA